MLSEKLKTPGVYREDVFLAPAAGLRTGVPAFLGYTAAAALVSPNTPQVLTVWPQFEESFGPWRVESYLGDVVLGFFQNEGQLCFVVRLDETLEAGQALQAGLEALASLDTIDLVCAPDIVRPRPDSDRQDRWSPPLLETVCRLQNMVLDHCNACGDRFALLDSLPCAEVGRVQEQRSQFDSANGALYYPWVRGRERPGILNVPECSAMARGFTPPCGAIAGIIARTDQRVGVHKAPANAVLEGVSDLERSLTNAEQDSLNPAGVNCLRAFPGRGLRVWGARTLASDPAWAYVNVRRLVLTTGRWIKRSMADLVFEPNDARVWAHVSRELTAYLDHLYRQGALQGRAAQEAFYVKCDAQTNPPEVREAGQLVTEIGLAPASPNEFIVVRITHRASGVSLAGPGETA